MRDGRIPFLNSLDVRCDRRNLLLNKAIANESAASNHNAASVEERVASHSQAVPTGREAGHGKQRIISISAIIGNNIIPEWFWSHSQTVQEEGAAIKPRKKDG